MASADAAADTAQDILHMQCIPSCYFDRIVSNQQAQGACVECEGCCHQWFHTHCLELEKDDLKQSYICDVCAVIAVRTTPAPASKKCKLMGLTAKLQRNLLSLPRTHSNVCYDFRSVRYPSLKLQNCDPTLLQSIATTRQSLASTGVAVLQEAIDVTDLNRALSSVKQGYVLSGSIAETNIWPMAERYKCIRQLPVRHCHSVTIVYVLRSCDGRRLHAWHVLVHGVLTAVASQPNCPASILHSVQGAVQHPARCRDVFAAATPWRCRSRSRRHSLPYISHSRRFDRC